MDEGSFLPEWRLVLFYVVALNDRASTMVRKCYQHH